MKQIILGCFLALLVACGDSTSEVYKENMSVVAEVSDLPDCTEENEGELVFVTADSAMRVCAKEKWYFAENSSPTFDYSCTTKELKNKKGIKVVCNGDSVGVVLNGSQGKTGRAGEGCTIDDWTDSTVTITCGDSTVTLEIGGSRTPDVKDTVVRDSDEVPLDSEAVAVSLDSLAGYTQKGPFTKGSTVYLYELSDGRTLKQTNGNFTSNIISDDGRYKFTARDLTSQYALLIVDGYYRNEVTGAVSGAPIRLKAISNMLMRRSANVNLLTHLEFERVYYLVTKEKMTVRAAKRKAQKEILTAFHIDTTGMKTESEDLNVFGSSDADAALLAISILLQGDRSETDLMALLAEISNDLAEDGLWNDDRSARIKAEIADWAFSRDMSNFRKNVEGWELNNGKPVGDFEKYINNFIANVYGIEVCKSASSKKVTIKNEKSIFNGKQYECYKWDGVPTWIDVRSSNPHLSPIDTLEMVDWRNRRLYHAVHLSYAINTVDSATGTAYREHVFSVWMAENLDFEYRVNGEVYGNYCYNDDCNSEKAQMYGRYYTWAAAMDSAGVYSSEGLDCGFDHICNAAVGARGVCPDGWHLPSKSEWETLIQFLKTAVAVSLVEYGFELDNPSELVGLPLKSKVGWLPSAIVASAMYPEAIVDQFKNYFGFSAVPAGVWSNTIADSAMYSHVGNYYIEGEQTNFWSSTPNGLENAYLFSLRYDSDSYRLMDKPSIFGYSIRCKRNSSSIDEGAKAL